MTTSIFEDKLKSSGLTMAHAQAMGMRFLTAAQTKALHPSFKAIPSLQLLYWDPYRPGHGLTYQPGWTQFYRLRYLTDAPIASFPTRPQRYTQEPGSGVCAYFPTAQGLDWPRLLADPTAPLLITEGELKAAKACVEGFPCIGLGGVYNFQATKHANMFLAELSQATWVRRQVTIVYDSDAATNPAVAAAVNVLASRLTERGAHVSYLALPHNSPPPAKKTGLDDLLVHHSRADLAKLLLDNAEPLGAATELWALNDEVAYVQQPSAVVVLATQQVLRPSSFVDHAYSHRYAPERQVRPTGEVSYTLASAARLWLNWPLRHTVASVTYQPGAPAIIHHATHSVINFWSGWGCAPHPGSVKPFLNLIAHLFKGAEPAATGWFLRWLAYPLQHPGTKLLASAVLHGRVHGTGKSTVGYTMSRIYGANFGEIHQGDLDGAFNDWLEQKQFILADDVTGTASRRDADRYKKMITQQFVTINKKYEPTYTIPDCVNYLWTSNQPDAFFLEDTDRRFFIHEITAPPLTESFYMDYQAWLTSTKPGQGASAIFHYLLHQVDTSDFNPSAPAFVTKAKERMIDTTRSDLGSWVRALLDHPEQVLRQGQIPLRHDMYTNTQLMALYDPAGTSRVTPNGLGRELARAGAPQVLGGAKLSPNGQRFDRYYIVRNIDRWANESSRDVVIRHLNEPTASHRPRRS